MSSPPAIIPPPTLLPNRVAQAVSFATRSTGLALRLGSFVGGRGLDAARFTTLSSLQLARGMVEAVLSRAARDTLAPGSGSYLAAADAESILERSLESLHYAVSQLVFWTAAGFHLTGATLGAATDAASLLLASLDQLLGSTDSSRAMASIVTLVRREFNNPATGARGESVGVFDLVLSLAALAYLQRSCWRAPAEESRRRAYEETIWDVVVLSDGQRVDVEQQQQQQGGQALPPGSPQVLAPPRSSCDDDETVLARFKSQIVDCMPPGTAVDIANSVSSVQTITVDVRGPRLLSLPTPSGAEIVETRGPMFAPSTSSLSVHSMTPSDGPASYRVVYRIERDRVRTAYLQRGDNTSGSAVVVEVPGPSQPPRRSLEFEDDGHSVSARLPYSCPSPFESDSESGTPSSPVQFAMSGSVSTAPSRATSTQTPVTSPSRIPRPSPPSAEVTANQKKQRQPLGEPSSRENVWPRLGGEKRSNAKKKSDSTLPSKSSTSSSSDKKSGLKQVLKGRGQSLSSMWNSKEQTRTTSSVARPRPQPPSPSPAAVSAQQLTAAARSPMPPPPRASPSRRSLHAVTNAPELETRPGSRASFFSVQSRRRDSGLSLADVYSQHAAGRDVAPSIYSLATANDSQSSPVLASYYQKSAYQGSDALGTLRREGFVDGAFPAGPLLPNIARYMRFSSACYGSRFLKVMGISTQLPSPGVCDGTHNDVRHFAHHTESAAGNILLASFVDPQGGADASGATGTGVPLVHYISLDHAAKAVVLACRGTLGFEDVLADLACEYDELSWRGRRHRVHKGMHASARRLLDGNERRVLVTINEALHEFPEYGLVMCGHSLGAGVTSLLGVMLAQPNPDGPGFVTSADAHARLLTARAGNGDHGGGAGGHDDDMDRLRLPAGRRIHVYAYGSPGVMSASLGKMTRGLITSVVHGNDLVPHLSLGVLHDFQALALALKHDDSQTKAEIRQRVWQAVQTGLADRWRRAGPRPPSEADEERWMLPALSALRDSAKAAKLVPPGEVFAIETQQVLRRDAFVHVDGEGPVGRPAQRVVLKYIRDVETRFGEIRFGSSLLTDHSPAKYEDALNMLRLGVD